MHKTINCMECGYLNTELEEGKEYYFTYSESDISTIPTEGPSTTVKSKLKILHFDFTCKDCGFPIITSFPTK